MEVWKLEDGSHEISLLKK